MATGEGSSAAEPPSRGIAAALPISCSGLNLGPVQATSLAGSEPGDVRVKGTIQVVAEDEDGVIDGCECGMKTRISQSRLPRRAEAHSRISARLGLSLRSFRTFPCRPSPRHVPAMALLDVPCSGQAFASRSDRTPFFGRDLSKPESIVARLQPVPCEGCLQTSFDMLGLLDTKLLGGQQRSYHGVELAKIRDEVALNTSRWKKLQSEKEELERRFEEEVKQLRRQQQEELQVLEQRLQEEYNTKKESLQEQHRLQLEQVKLQHQDQVEDITAVHEAAMLQLENNHIVAITVLQDENDCKIQELNAAHKLEKAQLEENFEKLRLSLQDQIDTLTFQNQSLKAKADRFEEALKKNTEEQLKIVRAPYLHLEKDLKSLKHVLEMKNHQIHQQEKMIMELEKQAEKNLKLEEKITMLQQQNEELRARIEQNTVITRQLSEENANLQEYVEKEVEEKKKLSRTNEELLWKLQEGDAVSPVKLPPTSSTSFYRCSSGNSSPAKVRTLRR
ncbi:microtubule-associated tumor suppressor candidate 2 [Grus japonensis]|uniref:Microtubule-associated tumor suppressor candidate 2 n=1 Tax=Grus japonensis TaxID=30415 RepID=A0ABC9W6F0_GRUJA